jgi:membrane glycosyltransferase
MQVANHFFENAMTFFTSMLQVSISLMVANGDVAPFVGHNAFLRWSAIQECAQIDPYDGASRVWSESHVSEDFQIALTLQSKGWMLRWATYSNMQFEEGVSLSAMDELARWQKYSYGCS